MAIIQKIRNKAGLLVSVVIGAALVAFILGDFLKPGNTKMGSGSTTVAEINGKSVHVQTYQNALAKEEGATELLYGQTSMDAETSKRVRQMAWQNLVSERVLGREYEKLGLSVSGVELSDLMLGDNPHMIMRQFFGNPQTREFDPQNVRRFYEQVSQLDPSENNPRIWYYFEDIILRDQKQQKYNTLISKGLYSTTLEAKKAELNQNLSVDFSYVLKRYTELSDSNITVSDSEVKAYYKKHKEEYKREKSRDIRYAVWEVTPTPKDYEMAKADMVEATEKLAKMQSENAWTYIRSQSDIAPNDKNFVQGELDTQIDSFAFSSEEGAVFGPYFEDEHYKSAKLIKTDYLPDSVRASHILLRANTQQAFMQMQQLADSLKTAIENGANFAELARTNSQDGSSTDGGDLGWFKEGQMVRPFNDSCFYGKTGDLKMVYSEFGIHIVKITKQSRNVKKVKVGILAQSIGVSDADEVYYYQANEFGGKNQTAEKFEAAIKANPSIAVVNAVDIKLGDQEVSSLEGSRELVRWAFNAKVGDVTSKVHSFGNKYVVAILDKINDGEYADLADVKLEIEAELKKQKKAEKIEAEMAQAVGSSNSINDVANKLGANIKNAVSINFNSFDINGAREPAVIAASTGLEKGKLSKPIAGENGVYLIQVDNINQAEISENLDSRQRQLERSHGAKLYNALPKVLNDLAEVEDKRISFPSL